jgi:predicted extracellular nuclease
MTKDGEMKTRLLILAALAVAVVSAQVIPIDSVRRFNAFGVPVDSGRTVQITGVFTATTQFGGWGPAFVEDNTGGVAIFDSTVAGYATGDSVTLTARIDFYRGLTELKSPAFTLVGTGKSITPRVLLAAHLGDTVNNREINEGLLAKVRGVFDTTGVFLGNRSYPFKDLSGRGTVYIDSSVSNILNKPIPTDTIDLLGCVSQFDMSSPFFSGYQLMPRSYADVGGAPSSGIMTIAQALADNDSNTIPDLEDSTVTVTGIVTVPSGVFATTKTDIYIQDQTGGVDVYDYTVRDLKLGDSLVVTGTVTVYRGKVELTSPQIEWKDSNHVVPAPTPLTCNQMNHTRSKLGSLVVLHGVSSTSLLVSGSTTLVDTSGSAELYPNSTTDVNGFVMVQDTFSLIGILSQYDASAPYNSGYEIVPRWRTDFSRGLEEQLSLLTIADVQSPGPDGYSSRYEGQWVKVHGRVTGPSYIFSSGSSPSLYIQDSTNGVNVYSPAISSGDSAYIDSLGADFMCIGKVDEYNGLTEISSGAMTLLNDTLRPVEPVVLPFNGFMTEAMESKLISVTGDVITPPANAGSGKDFTIKNGNPGLDVRVVNSSGIILNWVNPGKRVQVVGIVGQYSSSAPYATGYQVMPRFGSDLVDLTFPESVGLKMAFESVTPEVFNPSGGVPCDIKVQSPGDRKLYLQVFDLEGRTVKDLLVNVPGHAYEVTWDGSNNSLERLPIGTYILNLKGVRDDGKTEVVRKLVVLGTRLK